MRENVSVITDCFLKIAYNKLLYEANNAPASKGEDPQVLKSSNVLSFRDHDEFSGLVAELGETAAIPGGLAFRCDTPFASVRNETYRLFDFMDLEFFEILPRADIDFRYELGANHFKIGYVTEGDFLLATENYGGSLISPVNLYISPPSGSRGRVTYYKDRILRTMSFIARRDACEVMRGVLGESGCQLWAEAVIAGGREKRCPYPLTTPPPGVVNALLRAANRGYPHRIRRLFLENVFRDILLRLIAHGLPNGEINEINEINKKSSGVDSSDAERIKRVPGILMARFDSPPTVAELARELSMNATKLQSGFKKIFGKPIYAYHRGACLERAAVMLLDTGKSIFEIAMDTGYSGSGNFCNAFKKHYGLSPGRYRQKGELSL
jgi:AraC-like DNA-binding protein